MCEFLPLRQKGGGGGRIQVLAMLKGGHKTFWGIVYMVAGRFSRIEGGCKKFPLFKKGGGRKSLTLS